jgi:hypothetical protein
MTRGKIKIATWHILLYFRKINKNKISILVAK